MNRRLRLLVVPVLLATAVGLAPAGAQDPSPEAPLEEGPPPGAVDGQPAGVLPDGSETPAVDSGEAAAPSPPEASAAAAATTRYFSRTVYTDIRNAVGSTMRGCTVSNDALTAMVLSPVFFESSGALTPSSAPSPMTLSRYDEWNGQTNNTTNGAANRTLYESFNVSTPFQRAYWHPGIGIWQYDEAGLGAPYSAVQRMDARVVAVNVAQGIAQRYCSSRGAGGTEVAARKAAWSPWVGCANRVDGGCEQLYQELVSSGFSSLSLLDGIARLGGTEMRTCSLPDRGTFPCAYVDPNRAQGARWWVNLAPNDGRPTVAPAPLSLPFYDFTLDGREHRHWLRADTGYGVGISATRQLGKNSRFRSDQPGSGLAWSRSSTLCDLTALRGTCVASPPPSKRTVLGQVSGTYTPVVGDFDGSGVDDIFWYGPGLAGDALWFGRPDGTFTSSSVTVNGTFRPFVGDFDGDARDDIYWYAPGGAADYIWYGASPFSARVVVSAPVSGTYQPLVGDFDGNGRDDVFWYAPGPTGDSIWYGRTDRRFVKVTRPVSGDYAPVVGNFDGASGDDIFWYRAGGGTHAVWYGTGVGSFRAATASLAGRHAPMGGDFDGDGRGDVFFYGPGAQGDAVWYGAAGSSFTKVPISVRGTYAPVVADLQGDGRSDVVWYAAGVAADVAWYGRTDRGFTSAPANIPFAYTPLVGQFDGGPGDDIYWYAPGTAYGESIWLDPLG